MGNGEPITILLTLILLYDYNNCIGFVNSAHYFGYSEYIYLSN